VTQGAKSASCLWKLRDFFGVGSVGRNRRHDNHKEDLYRYSVVRRADLVDVIVPFFKEHPLRSSKRRDFEKFAKCLGIMVTGRHLEIPGLIEIAEIAETMNHRKSRRELIRILRGHTSSIQGTG
jgi:hypothetical protein